jgi:folate-binding protein YgfZ
VQREAARDGYEALRNAAGLYLDEGRTVLRVRGGRARQSLHGLLSNDIASLEEGQAVYSFALTPKGRPLADPRVIDLGDELWLDVAVVSVQPLREHLDVYLPPRFAQVSVIEGITRASLIGPSWVKALAQLDPGAAAEAEGAPCLTVIGISLAGSGELTAVTRAPEEGAGIDVYLPKERRRPTVDAIRRAIEAVGGATVGSDAFEPWRIELGIPVFGHDISADNLVQETGLTERTVSFQKGCYTGQEVVARIYYRGHVNRHLRGLSFSAETPPEHSAPIYLGQREVGQVTSCTLSPRLGLIGLGYVRREVAPGTALALAPDAETICQVVELPFTVT